MCFSRLAPAALELPAPLLCAGLTAADLRAAERLFLAPAASLDDVLAHKASCGAGPLFTCFLVSLFCLGFVCGVCFALLRVLCLLCVVCVVLFVRMNY